MTLSFDDVQMMDLHIRVTVREELRRDKICYHDNTKFQETVDVCIAIFATVAIAVTCVIAGIIVGKSL